MDIINFSKIAAPKFEFGCGFYFCVIGALKYIIGKFKYQMYVLHLILLHSLLTNISKNKHNHILLLKFI